MSSKDSATKETSVMGSSWIRGSLLGAGAFGHVNLAMDRVTGSFFAVKTAVCFNESDVDADAGAKNSLAAMENEIQILQGLESEFVVRCLGNDWSEEGGKRMRNVFLEYMPGGSLSDLLKQFAGAQPLDEHLIRSYTQSILRGIDYLHNRGIVHCDIKGRNVLVGNAGRVKLADFGSAKRINASAGIEVSKGKITVAGRTCGVLKEQELERQQLKKDSTMGKVNGTLLWMAPEVVLQKEQGLPSDIWSLGCTVVEMATGRAPWAHIADPLVALYRIGCTDEVPQTPACLSQEAHDFLAHCFQRDPCKRWTAAQLLQHPFLTVNPGQAPASCVDAVGAPGFQPSKKTQVVAPASPTSVLELHHGSTSSSLVLSPSLENSIPRLSTPSFWKKLAALESPRNRPQIEETRQTGNSSSKDWWGMSPLSPLPQGEWIVVRSPKANSKPQKKFETPYEFADAEITRSHPAFVVADASNVKREILIPEIQDSSSTSSAHRSLECCTQEDLPQCPPAEFFMESSCGASAASSFELFPTPPTPSACTDRVGEPTVGQQLGLSSYGSCSVKSLSRSSTSGFWQHQMLVGIKPNSVPGSVHHDSMENQSVSIDSPYWRWVLSSEVDESHSAGQKTCLRLLSLEVLEEKLPPRRIQIEKKVSLPWISEYKHLRFSQYLSGLCCTWPWMMSKHRILIHSTTACAPDACLCVYVVTFFHELCKSSQLHFVATICILFLFLRTLSAYVTKMN